MLQWLQNADWAVLHWIRDALHCGVLDFLMPKITALGNGGAVWLAGAAALLFFKKYRKFGIALLAALAIGVLVGNVFLKHLFARPRPCWLENAALLIANPTDYSFPSGHTLSAVIAATVLSLTDYRFGLVAVPLAALIAFSRLYLFVHFPTDVLASVLLGVAIGVLTLKGVNALPQKILPFT